MYSIIKRFASVSPKFAQKILKRIKYTLQTMKPTDSENPKE